MNPCTVPIKVEDSWGDKLWIDQHERHKFMTKESEPEVVFLGDTIINYLSQSLTWLDLFEPLHCLNFGILGDKIENILWRVNDGILDNIKPKVVVILAGTNNVRDSPENIADGILELNTVVKTKLPNAYIVICELLPRGRKKNKIWETFFEVNNILKEKLTNNDKIEFISHDFSELIAKDEISHNDFFDYLRLTESGFRKVFTPIHEIILQLLQEDEREKYLTPQE